MAISNWHKVVALLCGVTISGSVALADIPAADIPAPADISVPATEQSPDSNLQIQLESQAAAAAQQPVQREEPRAALEAPPGLERASGEKLATAIGHYSRARAYLIEAIRAFDKASALASPDSLIDSQEWRQTLVSRAEDLERVLSPQPRVSRGGVKFDAAPELLNDTGE